MKKLFLLACVMAVAVPALVAFGSPRVEKAVVEFKQPVQLQNQTLKGKYLILHDEQKMAAGLDCTYVYEYAGDEKGRLVLSFHCTPVPRPEADGLTISYFISDVNGSDVKQIREIQFKGSKTGHKIPAL